MAYPGEYRREEYYGEDGYAEGGNYGVRGYQPEEGYGESYGGNALPLFGEQYEHHKHGHHHHQRPEYVPEVEYVQPGVSDLGMGLRDSNYVQGGYDAGYGRNQPGYAVQGAYGPGGQYDTYERARVERLEAELAHERRREHEAEAAAAGATAYALHERHERKESEEELERFEPWAEENRHRHHFFNL